MICFGADVHHLDLFRRNRRDLGGGAEEHLLFQLEAKVLQRRRLRRAPHEHAVVDEVALGVDGRVGLRDDVLLFLICREVDDLVGDLALLHHPVGRLDEAERVDPGERREAADQADVGTLRRLDRTHPAVVREVDVAHFEAGPLTRQTARAERRETAPVGETRQRVDLVHELRQLRGAEELLDRRDHRADVDQGLRGDRLDVLGGHALTHHPLHAGQADTDLVLDELADAADAAVGEVVLIVEAVARLALGEVEQVGGGRQHLGLAEHRLVLLGPLELQLELLFEEVELRTELAVELVAPDSAQVVAAGLEEGVAEVGAGRLDRGRLTGPGSLVDLEERLFLGRRDLLVLFPLPLEEVEVGDELVEEAGLVLLVVAEGPQQGEQRDAALAGDAGAGGDVLAGLLLHVELDPLPAVGVDRAGDELVLAEVAQPEPLTRLEDDAGRTHELADHDTLGAVDDEGPLVGHHREVPHEDRLLLDLAGVGVHEPGAHEDRRAVGHVLFLALLHRELRRRAQILVVGIELQLELEGLREVADRRDVAEGLGQTLLEQPAEGLTLDCDEVWELQDLFEIAERIAFALRGACGHLGSRIAGGRGRRAAARARESARK